MARSEEASSRSSSGFEGAVAGMGLVDVLQVSSHNHFSGCVRVQHGDQSGIVFFRDGDIVHAEQGTRLGEEAFVDIMAWPQGRFSVEENVVTARRSITKSCEHLLLDAHRLLDERKAGRAASPPPSPPAEERRTPSQVTAAVRAVPGVEEVVVIAPDGQRVVDDGQGTEEAAGLIQYLSLACQEFGALFQGGELRSACVEGTQRHLLLFASRSRHLLGVLVRPDADVRAVDATVRAALTRPR